MNYLEGTSCNTRSLLDEIQQTKTEIGRLQLNLINLESQLYGNGGTLTYDHNGKPYVSWFNNSNSEVIDYDVGCVDGEPFSEMILWSPSKRS